MKAFWQRFFEKAIHQTNCRESLCCSNSIKSKAGWQHRLCLEQCKEIEKAKQAYQSFGKSKQEGCLLGAETDKRKIKKEIEENEIIGRKKVWYAYQ